MRNTVKVNLLDRACVSRERVEITGQVRRLHPSETSGGSRGDIWFRWWSLDMFWQNSDLLYKCHIKGKLYRVNAVNCIRMICTQETLTCEHIEAWTKWHFTHIFKPILLKKCAFIEISRTFVLAAQIQRFSIDSDNDLVLNGRQSIIWTVTRWHCFWKIPPIIAVKSSVTASIQVLRFVVDMFYCGRVAFTVFKHADIKGLRQRLTTTASLDDGYCEATSPVVKGHHVTKQWEDRVKRLSLRAHMRLLRGDY